jgi:TRAP-type C4-dicarboxylate transport system permease small subunit
LGGAEAPTVEEPRLLAAAAALLRLLGRLEAALAVLLILFVTLAIAASVLFRYGFAAPLIWVEEAVTIAFIWTTMLGAAVAAKMDRHVTIAALGTLLGGRGRLLLEILVRGTVLVVAAILARHCLDYVGMQNRSTTVSLPVALPRGWVFSIPTFVAMLSIALTQAVLLADAVARLVPPGAARAPLRLLEAPRLAEP